MSLLCCLRRMNIRRDTDNLSPKSIIMSLHYCIITITVYYALVSITPRLITSSTFHLGLFHVPLMLRSFPSFGDEKLEIDSSYSVSESLSASDFTAELDAATVSPAMPDENLSWRMSPTSSHARRRRSRSSFVCAADTQNRTLLISLQING